MNVHFDTRRLLIADDEPSIRTALHCMLDLEGYDVDEAVNGREAIEKLLAGGIELAILDLSMPLFDGLEVLHELKMVRGANAPPAIILTAHGSVSAAIDSTRYGAVDFLHKPISRETLLAAVRQALAGLKTPPLIDNGENYLG